jgi:thiamine-monophosphate kinase
LPGACEAALVGGDDYELLFTAPPDRRARIEALSDKLDLPLTCIGRIASAGGLRVLDQDGRQIPVTAMGWQHF